MVHGGREGSGGREERQSQPTVLEYNAVTVLPYTLRPALQVALKSRMRPTRHYCDSKEFGRGKRRGARGLTTGVASDSTFTVPAPERCRPCKSWEERKEEEGKKGRTISAVARRFTELGRAAVIIIIRRLTRLTVETLHHSHVSSRRLALRLGSRDSSGRKRHRLPRLRISSRIEEAIVESRTALTARLPSLAVADSSSRTRSSWRFLLDRRRFGRGSGRGS
jgi:hypothetical protein